MALHSDDSERLRLKIQPQPPKFPFKSHAFEITMYLVDGADQLRTGIKLPLQVDLVIGDKPSDRRLLRVDPSTKPVIETNGMCKLKVAIEETSMAHGNKKMYLSITPGDNRYDIASVVSTEMTVIRHRLVIQEELPDLWYKDEGGRDKCMLLPVHLVDQSNNPVGTRPVPLRVTLLYDNEHAVLKQDILKMSPDSQRVIDQHGKAVLKLRIEDVSKNHQGQAFRLKVEADTAQSPINFDVAYDLSTPISVRSKRNKRRGPSTTSASLSLKTSHLLPGEPHGSSPTNLDLISPSEEQRKRQRQDLEIPTSSAKMNPSMESVLSWTGSVVQGLQHLEWQPIGFETKPDGSMDRDRPIYRCPACWRYKDTLTFDTQQHDAKCLIANLLLTYATETVHHYDALLKLTDKIQERSKGFPSSTPTQSNSSNNSMYPTNTNKPSNNPMTVAANTGPPTLQRGITDMVNSLDVPPNLFRGNSTNLADFSELLEDSNGTNFLAPTSNEVSLAIEVQVYCVLAKMSVLSNNAYAGFPAFDMGLHLLGFYQESNDTPTTQIVFCPINDIHGITNYEVQRFQMMVRQELKEESKAVFRLDRFSNDLNKLKENVMFFHWETNKERQVPQWVM
ncbi:hypothetical protein THRCLA_01362 [Thraustotheca clavata]|uniref:Uncharacterized protein n=1 Tax=Thraustotheca clavata TaxID=74557 RepID=A0A1W0A8H7_9STRA|nr:hypothetical protein THRCLA_01362 [Thraustotheca clavata]